MNRRPIVNRALGALLLVALASASLAPAALADRGHVRYKRGGPVLRGPGMVRVVHRGPVFIERRSDAGALVGFLGGLVLGTVLSSTPPPPPPPVYEYYDPYCRERFATLEAYDEHLYYRGHPGRAEVIEVHSGRCVDTLERRDGRWYGRDDRYRDDLDRRDPAGDGDWGG
jgi:hypothetical protein